MNQKMFLFTMPGACGALETVCVSETTTTRAREKANAKTAQM